MKQWVCLLVGLSLSAGCAAGRSTPEPVTEFRGEGVPFAFDYPSGWAVTVEGPHRLGLAAPGERDWQPSVPADIPQDPRIWIDYGAGIRERLGPAAMPEEVDADGLRAWLEQKVAAGSAEGLSERMVNGATAFEVRELSVPGCQQVVYWGPGDPDHLVRLATGCQSPHLAAFTALVNSLRITP